MRAQLSRGQTCQKLRSNSTKGSMIVLAVLMAYAIVAQETTVVRTAATRLTWSPYDIEVLVSSWLVQTIVRTGV